eukprot:CAMPEP_0119360354 /NCGR_PEP_ID=MMETSP1334-20130426/7992_1 /TAXON_ID=127549 /ORGANISM="Calcidiscus leptoporus, Strain RCC1130" /LENGTH=62 /DNA_ID=CAMNT_0007375189 /DNA_START=239 /DNA_END=427 /DNA_ORIENTATION=+
MKAPHPARRCSTDSTVRRSGFMCALARPRHNRVIDRERVLEAADVVGVPAAHQLAQVELVVA